MADNNELEKTLWAAADKMRSNMDAAEYKHIVLGLIFLKYISDAFDDLYQKLAENKGEHEGANAEDGFDRQDRPDEDVAGFCKAATLDEVLANIYGYMPVRYARTEVAEYDGVPFAEKRHALTTKLPEQFARGNKLQKTIHENLKGIGYDF